ncbi:hypothetical protein B0T10DRAFT_48269 [Thelonectria olida]|uniref:DUF1308 domain-containing protein n=1 Tax=Thelonectria olida TaxID=1576542 RepID=A0A9P8W4I6_9HYPO|nr:hypothetical protein B0T10DRAFT_48269 [Thelonectria olida]
MTTINTPDPDDDPSSLQPRMLQSAQENSHLAHVCIQEVTALADRVKTKASPLQSTGLPTFLRVLQREKDTVDLIARIATEDAIRPEETLKQHNRRLEASVNVVSRSVAQWDRLKRCCGLVSVNKNFQGSSRNGRREEMIKRDISGRDKQTAHRLLKEQGRVEVDVVDLGREWLAVKAVHRDRLARELGDCGWAWGDHELGDRVDEDEWDDVPLAKFAKRLVAAAKLNRHEYHFPRIRLVLSNLCHGNDELDIFIDQLKHLDPLVQVTIEYQDGVFMSTPPPPLQTALANLVGGELEHLTQTLNLDHTILIDMISDLTHASLQPQPWQAQSTRSQIEQENLQPGGIMAAKLYPLLAGRKLICTMEAADHFHRVLEAVGTETERERGALLLPDDQSMSKEAIRERFQQLSIHPLPEDVQLPLDIAPEPWDKPSIEEAVSKGVLPEMALDVVECSGFKSAKLSIFVYGWAAKIVTLTSNKEVRGQMRTWVEANRRSETDLGPSIWKLDVTRNLLAKNANPRPGRFRKRRDGEEEDDDSDDQQE